MKLACDNGISLAACDALEAAGHEVVFRAVDEPDEWWVREAIERGAECFVSCDWDIELMADDRGKLSVRLDGNGGVRGAAQAAAILAAIKRLEPAKCELDGAAGPLVWREDGRLWLCDYCDRHTSFAEAPRRG